MEQKLKALEQIDSEIKRITKDFNDEEDENTVTYLQACATFLSGLYMAKATIIASLSNE